MKSDTFFQKNYSFSYNLFRFIFHCMESQVRGPSCANKFVRRLSQRNLDLPSRLDPPIVWVRLDTMLVIMILIIRTIRLLIVFIMTIIIIIAVIVLTIIIVIIIVIMIVIIITILLKFLSSNTLLIFLFSHISSTYLS